MLYAADNGGGTKILATPKARALCPACGDTVIAKCGKIKVWHWAHRSADCDAWAEGETDWHLWWKSQFENVEVTMRRGGEWHRADAVTDSGWVIEFQHSSISPAEIERREQFYKRMIWVFDARDAARKYKTWYAGMEFEESRLRLYHSDDNRADVGYCTFRWKQARKSLSAVRSALYLDVGDGWLLRVGKMYFDGTCAGWGHQISYSDFLKVGQPHE